MTIIRWRTPMYSSLLENLNETGLNNVQGYNKHQNPVNILENDDSFKIEVAAPGREKEDFRLQIEDNKLTLSLESQENQEEEKDQAEFQHNYIMKEFDQNITFSRSFSIPRKTDSEKISATYNNGILTITIPKLQPEPRVSKRIDVS